MTEYFGWIKYYLLLVFLFKNILAFNDTVLLADYIPTRGKPWHVTINPMRESGTRFEYSGALIGVHWVLTSAFVVKGSVSWDLTFNLEDITQMQRSRTACYHRKYRDGRPENDIGIIKTPIPLTFTDTLYPVHLEPPCDIQINQFRRPIDMSGWRRWNKFEVLRYIECPRLSVMNMNECRSEMHDSTIREPLLCLRDRTRTCPCYTNSGSPLVYKGDNDENILLGHISFFNPHNPFSCVGAIRVSYYIEWIETMVCEL